MTAGLVTHPRALWSAAVVMTVAVFAIPLGFAAVHGYAGEQALVAAATSAVVRAGTPGGSRDAALADLVGFWRDFHLVKAGLAGVLVVLLAVLASAIGGRARELGPGWRRRRVLAAYAGVLLWLLGSLTILLANVQGVIAPLSSVASMLPTAHPSGPLGESLVGVRRSVGIESHSSTGGFARELLVDFTAYHGAFAMLAATAGLALTALAVRAGTDRLLRRPEDRCPTWPWRLGMLGAAGALFLVLAAANVSTWINPVPAFLASLT